MIFLPAAMALLLASPQSQLTEIIEVRLHTIDVVVTNDKGEPVTGLRADDFEVLEDGAPQTITNFSAYDETIAAQTPTPSPQSPQTLVAPATPQPPPRVFVFFIDEMGILALTRDSLLANLRAFVANMREGDRAAVVRPEDSAAVELKFTSDRQTIERELTEALSESVIIGRRNGLAGNYFWHRRDMEMAHGEESQRAVLRRTAARVAQRVKQRLGTMRAIIAAIAPLDGRKVLIGVTQSLSGEPGREFFDEYIRSHHDQTYSVVREALDEKPPLTLPNESTASTPEPATPVTRENNRRLVLTDLRPAIADIARIASSSGVTFYAIRPENDITLTDASPDLTSVKTRSSNTNLPSTTQAVFLQSAIANTKKGIDPIVDITGGRHFDPSDEFSDVMRRITADLSSYYSLGYHGQSGLDRPHKIVARVRNRPELRVHAKSEVERKSAPRELTDRVVSSLVTTQAPNDLGIAVRVESKPSRKQTTLTVGILIPIAALQFERVGDVYRARYDAHYAITGRTTDFVSGVDRDRTIEIPARDFASAREKYWTHTVTMEGNQQNYRVAVGVMDLHNERSGIVAMDIDAMKSEKPR